MEHDVLSVAAEIHSLIEKRTRHPPIRASKRKKITDLIDLLLSTNVKNKVEVQKAPEYSVSFLCVITSNFGNWKGGLVFGTPLSWKI